IGTEVVPGYSVCGHTGVIRGGRACSDLPSPTLRHLGSQSLRIVSRVDRADYVSPSAWAAADPFLAAAPKNSSPTLPLLPAYCEAGRAGSKMPVPPRMRCWGARG